MGLSGAGMTFSEALYELKTNRLVARLVWLRSMFVAASGTEVLLLCQWGRDPLPLGLWIPGYADLFACDWYNWAEYRFPQIAAERLKQLQFNATRAALHDWLEQGGRRDGQREAQDYDRPGRGWSAGDGTGNPPWNGGGAGAEGG